MPLPADRQTPRAQVAAGNAWYVDDQFANQLRHPGAGYVVRRRWRLFEAVLRRRFPVPSAAPLVVLDAGCGDGINLIGLQTILDRLGLARRLIGTDYNVLRLDRADGQGAGAEIFASSLRALPLADASVDVVLCNHVLEHIHQDTDVLGEFRRVLRPGGLLILGVPNEGCLMARLRNGVIQPAIGRATDHVQFYTADDIRSRLGRSGLAVDELHRLGWFMPWTGAQSLFQDTAVGRLVLRGLNILLASQSAELIAIAGHPRHTGGEPEV